MRLILVENRVLFGKTRKFHINQIVRTYGHTCKISFLRYKLRTWSRVRKKSKNKGNAQKIDHKKMWTMKNEKREKKKSIFDRNKWKRILSSDTLFMFMFISLMHIAELRSSARSIEIINNSSISDMCLIPFFRSIAAGFCVSAKQFGKFLVFFFSLPCPIRYRTMDISTWPLIDRVNTNTSNIYSSNYLYLYLISMGILNRCWIEISS